MEDSFKKQKKQQRKELIREAKFYNVCVASDFPISDETKELVRSRRLDLDHTKALDRIAFLFAKSCIDNQAFKISGESRFHYHYFRHFCELTGLWKICDYEAIDSDIYTPYSFCVSKKGFHHTRKACKATFVPTKKLSKDIIALIAGLHALFQKHGLCKSIRQSIIYKYTWPIFRVLKEIKGCV